MSNKTKGLLQALCGAFIFALASYAGITLIEIFYNVLTTSSHMAGSQLLLGFTYMVGTIFCILVGAIHINDGLNKINA